MMKCHGHRRKIFMARLRGYVWLSKHRTPYSVMFNKQTPRLASGLARTRDDSFCLEEGINLCCSCCLTGIKILECVITVEVDFFAVSAQILQSFQGGQKVRLDRGNFGFCLGNSLRLCCQFLGEKCDPLIG